MVDGRVHSLSLEDDTADYPLDIRIYQLETLKVLVSTLDDSHNQLLAKQTIK